MFDFFRPVKFKTDECQLFFGSDFHFSHDKDFVYNKRGFETISEHDKSIIERIQKQVADSNAQYPILIYLGDFSLNSTKEYTYKKLEELGEVFAEIFYVFGNHESKILQIFEEYTNKKVPATIELHSPHDAEESFTSRVHFMGNSFRALIDKKEVYFTHLPVLDTPRFFKGGEIKCFCGHCHGNRKGLNLNEHEIPSYDLGIDVALKRDAEKPLFTWEEIKEAVYPKVVHDKKIL